MLYAGRSPPLLVMDEIEDLDNLSETARKDLIRKLQAERERRREYTERLQEKLKALNNELAARKEEADRNRKELQEEQRANKDKAEKRRAGEGGDDQLALAGDKKSELAERQVEKVTHFVEERLLESVGKNIKKNELGIRTFDETELMINKTKVEQDSEAKSIDTVLITYLKPNSEQRFNLSYRVDKDTLSKKLREDACLYWGVSEVEFILKTMENSKVHDNLTVQSCFRGDEKAHLLLDQKTPKKTVVEQLELDAIGPQAGKNAKRKKKKTDDKAVVVDTNRGLSHSDFYEQMAQLPGLWSFMTQRDQRTVAHLERIKLRNILAFGCLLAACIASFSNVRPPNIEFFCRHGLELGMTEAHAHTESGLDVVDFRNIETIEQIWEWLTYTVPKQLFTNTSSLRENNYFPGHVEIRMQQVAPASAEACGVTDSIKNNLPPDTLCQAETYTTASAGKDDFFEVELYWEGCNRSNLTMELCENLSTPEWYNGVAGVNGRSAGSSPWQYASTSESKGVGTEAGRYQRYDGSGYKVSYAFQFENQSDTLDAVMQDMTMLKQFNWISSSTRSIQVDFTVYNANYDYWVSNFFLLELPPTGVIIPVVEVDMFRPIAFASTRDVQLFSMDCGRMGLVVYILTYHISWEIAFERARGSTARTYLLSVLGLVDLLIAGIVIYCVFMRHVVYGYLGFDGLEFAIGHGKEFLSAKTTAYNYHASTITEAFLIALVFFRLTSLWRINRHVFIIWTTIIEALATFSKFLLVCLPIMLGFVAVAHTLWGNFYLEYSSYPSAFTAVLMDLYGVRDEMKSSKPIEIVYSALLYIVGVIVITNSWIAVLISSYQKVRVKSGYKPNDYKWKEYQYAKWALWSPFLTGYLKYIRPRIDRPKDPNVEED